MPVALPAPAWRPSAALHPSALPRRLAPGDAGAGARLVQELLTHDISSTLTVNNYFGVLQAVLANVGIGVLPDYLPEDKPSGGHAAHMVEHRRMLRTLSGAEQGQAHAPSCCSRNQAALVSSPIAH